jgi:hypothetical protein
MDEILTHFSLVLIDGCLPLLSRWSGWFVDHRRTAPLKISPPVVGCAAAFWLRGEAQLPHGRVFHKFKIGRCEVCIDIPINAKQPSYMAWSTSATGHEMSDTLEMVAHQALEMFCEQHPLDTANTPIAMFPIRNRGDQIWRERMKAGCDETQSMFHAGYVMSTLYTQHVCNLLYKVKMVNTYQHRELKDYGKQNAELKKANHELTKGVKLLRQNASAGAKERCEYCDLLMESQAENDHL